LQTKPQDAERDDAEEDEKYQKVAIIVLLVLLHSGQRSSSPSTKPPPLPGAYHYGLASSTLFINLEEWVLLLL